MIDEIQRFSRPALGETPILCNRQHDYCRFAAFGYGLGGTLDGRRNDGAEAVLRILQ